MDGSIKLNGSRQSRQINTPPPTGAFLAESKKIAANKRARNNRKARHQMLKDLGLTPVRGAVSGRLYWE
jgi:hypothetical protein